MISSAKIQQILQRYAFLFLPWDTPLLFDLIKPTSCDPGRCVCVCCHEISGLIANSTRFSFDPVGPCAAALALKPHSATFSGERMRFIQFFDDWMSHSWANKGCLRHTWGLWGEGGPPPPAPASWTNPRPAAEARGRLALRHIPGTWATA